MLGIGWGIGEIIEEVIWVEGFSYVFLVSLFGFEFWLYIYKWEIVFNDLI